MTCVATGDVECNELAPPPGICSNGDQINTIRFEYTGLDCLQGNCNAQEDDYTCMESSGGPPSDQDVLVFCSDGDEMLASDTVVPGDTITVPSEDSTSPLPASITCTVSSIDGSITYQTVTINTSGMENLYLGNKFGSLKLQACDDQDCIEDITYFYLLENVGTTPMTITVVDRTRNGETESLLNRLPTTNLDVGQSTVVTEMDTVDICLDNTITTTISARANPPSGVPCFDSEEYSLVTEGPCLVDAEITCTDADGTECNDLTPPNAQCAGGDELSVLRFRYEYRSCEDQVNNQGMFSSCVDAETCAIGPRSTVDISCEDIFPTTTVTAGDIISISGADGATLPDSITCEVRPKNGALCQTLIINTSGAIDLQLKDQFGSLELVGCDESDCFREVTYDYSIRNIGQVNMEINLAEITFNDNPPVSVLDQFSETSLAPNQTTSYSEQQTIDLCITDESVTSLDVDANAPGGTICEDKDFYTLITDLPPTPPITAPPTISPTTPPTPLPTISPTTPPTPLPTVIQMPPLPPPPTPPPPTLSPPPPPTLHPPPPPTTSAPPTLSPPPPPTLSPPPPPTTSVPTTPSTMAPTEECDITIDVSCVPIELPEESCEQLPPLVTTCDERPNWMQFKYFGGDCSQSANLQSEKFFCTDFAPLPKNGPVYIRAGDSVDANQIFFEGPVELNGLYNVTDPRGDRLPADMNLTVFELTASGEPGALLQNVKYHSSCSQNLFLKDRFGAHQLVAFFNELQGLVDCLIISNFTFTIANEGEVPAVLRSLVVLTTPFGPFDLTTDVEDQNLGPGETFVVYLPVELDFTVRQRYTVLATITGQLDEAAEPCSNSDFLDFVAGNALPPSIPTVAPTTTPTRSPAPTVNPEFAACTLVAGIDCEVTEGSVTSCDDLSAPTSQCLSPPTRLDFIFSGGSCIESTNMAESFDCMDDNGGIGDRESVYIVMANQEVLFEGEVRRGQTFSAVGEFTDAMTVTISSMENGDELQVMEIRTACEPQDDLTLLNTFGGLQLVGYENAQGFESTFASLRITYTVDNTSIKATVTEAIATSSSSGTQNFQTPFDLEYRESTAFPADQILVNLAESGTFEFSFDVRGVGFESGMMCESADTLVIATGA